MESKLQHTGEFTHNKRSSKEIEQDLAARGEQFSRTVEQLGEHIEEKLDWRVQVRKSPFWAVGTATGLGFLAAALLRRRSTPMERLLQTLDSTVRSELSGASSPGLIKVALMSFAARSASQWFNKAPARPAVDGAEPAVDSDF